jgi:nucleoside-diphosphate-sugar epimerase
MRVLIVGATGALGRPVAARLLERGHAVRAVARDPARARGLPALGAEVLPGDILEPASLAAAARGCDAALHLATAVPRPGTAGDWRRNDQVRRAGTQNLLRAAQAAGVRRYVQQSIIFLYAGAGDAWLDEEAPLDAGGLGSALEMEQQVRASGLEWCILRGGAFYGPGTGQEDHWRAQAQAGQAQLPGDGQAFISLIHTADMARAVALAVEAAPPGSLFNVVDDEPVRWSELLGLVAAQVGAPQPTAGGPARPSLRCRNQRLKAALGWQPAYPTFRSGLA